MKKEKELMKLNVQLFADDEGNDEPQNANNEPGNSNKAQTLKELLASNSNLQSEFDALVGKSNQTAIENARIKWQKEQDDNISEAEKLKNMTEKEKLEYQLKKALEDNKKLIQNENTRALKDKAIDLISGEDLNMDVSLLQLFDFSNTTAEKLNEDLKTMKTIFDKAVEKRVDEILKEDSPKNVNNPNTNSSEENSLAVAFGNAQ